MDIKDYRILLVVTKGCVACDIQERNINEAIKQSTKNIRFEKVLRTELKNKDIMKLKLKDFPTTALFVDDVLTFKFEGSLPTPIINRYIDLYMK